jgi:hypothetical protein
VVHLSELIAQLLSIFEGGNLFLLLFLLLPHQLLNFNKHLLFVAIRRRGVVVVLSLSLSLATALLLVVEFLPVILVALLTFLLQIAVVLVFYIVGILFFLQLLDYTKTVVLAGILGFIQTNVQANALFLLAVRQGFLFVG